MQRGGRGSGDRVFGFQVVMEDGRCAVLSNTLDVQSCYAN